MEPVWIRQLREELERSSPDKAVFVALDAASVCWDNVSNAGVFEAERAETIGELLCARLDININKEN